MRCEPHPHSTDRRSRVTAHVGERLAHHLRDHLPVVWRQKILAAVARQFDSNAIYARELVRLAAKVLDETIRADPRRAELRERFANLRQRTFQDLENVLQVFIRSALLLFEVE